MITTLKDDGGKIVAYCEWRLVGRSGLEVPSGEYLWINDCWVHNDYRQKYRINRIIDEVMRACPQARYGYFQRKNVSDKVHIWTRSQFERRRHRHQSLIQGEVK